MSEPQTDKDETTARVEICAAEVRDILEKYNCVLDPTVILKIGQSPFATVNVISK